MRRIMVVLAMYAFGGCGLGDDGGLARHVGCP